MIDVLLLRLEAPLMSFGDVAIDSRGPTRMFPTRSMLTGLCANALGHEHHEAARTSALQARLRFASRRDRAGETLRDFHTVDLGQRDARGVAWMADAGWTTRGAREQRGGGNAGEGTHIRERFYLADAIYTVALTLTPADGVPSLAELAAALDEPARPLFLGRKPCLPSSRLLVGRASATTLLAALAAAPLAKRATVNDGRALAEWPDDDLEVTVAASAAPESRRLSLTDERDWVNQVHVGRRFVREGMLRLSPSAPESP
jgi:CRISPR system Cascade subunit CasD